MPKYRSVYVASSWRNLLQPGVVAALRAAGLEVYDFRNPAPGVTDGFRWSAIDPDWLKWTPRDWREALAHPIAQRGYACDRGGMDASECCVLVLPSGRSAHLEAGFMAGQGKPVYTLALEPVEPDLMHLLLGPPETLCCSMDDLFDAMGVEDDAADVQCDKCKALHPARQDVGSALATMDRLNNTERPCPACGVKRQWVVRRVGR